MTEKSGVSQSGVSAWSELLKVWRNVIVSPPVHDEPDPTPWMCGVCPYTNVGPICTKCGAPRWEGREFPRPVVTNEMVRLAAETIHAAYQPDEGDDMSVAWFDAVRAGLVAVLGERRDERSDQALDPSSRLVGADEQPTSETPSRGQR